MEQRQRMEQKWKTYDEWRNAETIKIQKCMQRARSCPQKDDPPDTPEFGGLVDWPPELADYARMM